MENFIFCAVKGSQFEASNYRVTYLLPLISKTETLVIHDQTSTFLKGSYILSNYQSGFRKNHPTNLCLSYLKDKILKTFEKCLLIDIQKGFDTIDHIILLQNMEAILFANIRYHGLNFNSQNERSL